MRWFSEHSNLDCHWHPHCMFSPQCFSQRCSGMQRCMATQAQARTAVGHGNDSAPVVPVKLLLILKKWSAALLVIAQGLNGCSSLKDTNTCLLTWMLRLSWGKDRLGAMCGVGLSQGRGDLKPIGTCASSAKTCHRRGCLTDKPFSNAPRARWPQTLVAQSNAILKELFRLA